MAERVPDFYNVLGVGRDASAAEIRSAYRRLIRSAHPDAGGSEARFVLVQRAYETLIDPDERIAYDRGRARGSAPSAACPARSEPATRSSTSSTRSGAPTQPRPADVVYDDPGLAEPAMSPQGCVVALAVLVGVLVVLVAGIVAATRSTDTTTSYRGSTTTGVASLGTGEPFARWQASARPVLSVIVDNGGDVGAALSTAGAIDVQALRDACRQRTDLLDELERVGASTRSEIDDAVHEFVSSERRAMSACLGRPPDFERLAEWGERSQPSLRKLIDATR